MSSWILDMDKVDIDYETERDKRDMERAEEIRKITSGMVFVLKQRFDLINDASVFLVAKNTTTQLNVLMWKMYKYDRNRNKWLMNDGVDNGEIQVYDDSDGMLVATLPIINIKELRFTMDKLSTIEDILLDYIKRIRK